MTEAAKEPPPMLVEGIDLEAFERQMYAHDGTPEAIETCAKMLWEILGKVRRGSSFMAAEDDLVLVAHTRMAGAITALLCHPKFAIGPDGFVWLCSEHCTLHGIFRASAYKSMDHIIHMTSSSKTGTSMSFNHPQQVLLLLLCWSLESEIEIDWDQMHGVAPEATHSAMIGMLAIGCTHTERAYARRVSLMQRLDILGAHSLADCQMLNAGDLYMHCSYTDAPAKHACKPVMNRLLKELVTRRSIDSGVPVPEVGTKLVRKDRPRIVVPVEWFGGHHAMYRCYAMSIAQLRQRFEVICVYRETEIDEVGKAAFDRTVQITGAGVSVSEVIKAVEGLSPDILFYPSIGMAAWYITISNFRLAPIQICCPGHPASTHSDVMDYMVSDGDLFGDPANYTERIVPLPVGTARYMPRARAYPQPVKWANSRVAITAMSTKLIPPFFRTLQEIERRALKTVEFHFFPNMTGMSHFQARRDILKWFPSAVVHARDTYQAYIDNLCACDFAIDTWPFGGTNSVVDCLHYGVPVVCREGQEIHERSAASMLRRMRMPAWLIAQTEEQMIAAATRMLDGQYVAMPTAEQVEAEFYGDGPPEVHGGFLKAFEDIYERHCNAD